MLTMVYAFDFLNEGLRRQTPFLTHTHVLLHHLSARKVQKALDIYKEMIGTLKFKVVDHDDFACTNNSGAFVALEFPQSRYMSGIHGQGCFLP